ncbi:MAG: glycolate oxidase, partial [Clostridia bacterium]|nr:glycolate oxidase [Clostridia bacterium]
GMMVFDKIETALEVAQELQERGITPAALEFEVCAPEATRAAADYHKELYVKDAEMAIICEVDGNPASVAWEYGQVQEVARRYARAWRGADDPPGVKILWEAIDAIETFSSKVREGAKRSPGGEDICVKIDRLPAVLREMQAIARDNGIGIVNFGHLGQGNIHSGLLVHMDDPAETEGARRTIEAIHRLALRERGATTAEHGVGLVRVPYMVEEHGRALDYMAAVKRVFDPHGILNPGKIWPLPDAPARG